MSLSVSDKRADAEDVGFFSNASSNKPGGHRSSDVPDVPDASISNSLGLSPVPLLYSKRINQWEL